MQSVVQFVITDEPLVHGIYYNLHNRDNTSNIDKTEAYILKAHRDFQNINILLKRDEHQYEQAGRIQDEQEAREIDVILQYILRLNEIDFNATFKL